MQQKKKVGISQDFFNAHQNSPSDHHQIGSHLFRSLINCDSREMRCMRVLDRCTVCRSPLKFPITADKLTFTKCGNYCSPLHAPPLTGHAIFGWILSVFECRVLKCVVCAVCVCVHVCVFLRGGTVQVKHNYRVKGNSKHKPHGNPTVNVYTLRQTLDLDQIVQRM